MIRAKFRCESVFLEKDSERVKLLPVCDDVNKQWCQWTPSGLLEMQINNPSARGKFKPGEHYFLDFSVAPAKQADE